MPTRLIAGCMTGTSLDGLDTALARVDGAGLGMRATFVRGATRPLGELAAPLRALAEQRAMTAGDIARLSRDFAVLHAQTLQELAGPDKLDLVCVHGQTVFHSPPVSWQLMNPAPIARALRCPVVYDLRAADLAAGGQGAPITPIADWVFFGHLDGPVAVANLGGFCNITTFSGSVTVPAGSTYDTPTSTTIINQPTTLHQGRDPVMIADIQGFDLCACNQLLDAVARTLMNLPYDTGGARAAAGRVHHDALVDLEGIFNAQRASHRSLGTGDEVHEWISRFRARAAPDDLATTACETIARAIANATRHCRLLLLAGGGLKNQTLVNAIRSASSSSVNPTDAAGLPAEFREAAEFAVLGALCQDRIPITLPQVTGVPGPAPISGAWVYP